MNFTTLLMDADDTIFDFPKCEHDALRECMLGAGLDFSEEICRTFSAINAGLWKEFEKGSITRLQLRTERFRRLTEKCFPGFSEYEKLAGAYVQALSGYAEFLGNAQQTVPELSQIYEIYIITNGLKNVQQRRFALSGLENYISGVFISEVLGVQKPRKEFFDRVFADIPEKNKDNILVVGDSLTSDMQGGRNAGVRTCLFDPEDKITMPHPLCDYRIHDLLEITTL